ncbi:MAG: urease accessory protein UreD [Leptolyngbyaceae cyanobacterium SL_1_1]|nr:urease accessory protein UreD [Leptolyngbyaceae cyanobacterium RM1_1_2]NJO09504.1 urease accessory protein UreD [Leptolyngbyaceae cyanobacterium SL_1_1]
MTLDLSGSAPRLRPPTASQGWHGQLQLNFVYQGQKTVPLQPQTTAPLRLQRPFYPEGGVCHSVIVHTAGGMVGGDRLSLSLQLQPHSQALVTTAAAHKVYRSSGLPTQQQTQIRLQAQTCLEWFPQETIIFNGAQHQQMTRIDLEPGAIWLGWEITRFGRSARGEQFSCGQWRSQLEVWQQGQPLWLDRSYLQGGSDVLQSPHGLNGSPVIGSLALLGYTLSDLQLATLRDCSAPGSGDTGITTLINGVLCRYRGASSQAARAWFISLWQALRPIYLQRPGCLPRVWGR